MYSLADFLIWRKRRYDYLVARETESTAKHTKQETETEQETESESDDPVSPAPAERKPKRFHGTVSLDPARVRDAGRIADEVVSHLTGLVGTSVKVTLEIDAEIPSGAPDHVVRAVTENSRTLKFTSQGFESE